MTVRDHPHQRRADPDLERRSRIPRGEIGEIVVQGPVVTRSYFNRPDSTALAKIADPSRRLLASHGRSGIFG